jgi:outer membrane biosynthesis protein TonB
MKRLLPVILLVPALACAYAQAKSPAERPTLEVPPVPPRLVEATVPEVAPPEPVDPPATQAAPRPPRPQPQARETPKPEPKPEPPPAEPPPLAAAPSPAVPTLPQLRTPGTPEGAEASRLVRDLVDRTRKTLGSIDYQRLTAARRAEYDNATLSIKDSESALKSGRFDIALNLAEKAERIAKELQKR